MLLKNSKSVTAKSERCLRGFTSFKLGGKTRFLACPGNSSELVYLVKLFNSMSRDYYVLGAGSNVLINDSGIIKPVIKLGDGFDFIRRPDSVTVEAGAATPLRKFLNYCVRNNLGGAESFAGIPATLGGLCFMNASGFGREFCSLVRDVSVISPAGDYLVLKRDDIGFGYRSSSLKGFIIVKMTLGLNKNSKAGESIRMFLKERIAKQDFSRPSMGCVFKNPPGEISAGEFIDRCGLKGLRIGDAKVSLKHANFILNMGEATYPQVCEIISRIKSAVRDRFSVRLDEEIIRWEA